MYLQDSISIDEFNEVMKKSFAWSADAQEKLKAASTEHSSWKSLRDQLDLAAKKAIEAASAAALFVTFKSFPQDIFPVGLILSANELVFSSSGMFV